MNRAAFCLSDEERPEDEILYGVAGYLQTVVLIKKEMMETMPEILDRKRVRDGKVVWTDFKLKIDQVIEDVAVKLAK